MKKEVIKISLLGMFLTLTSVKAQDILWEKTYGGKHAEILSDVLATPDYGFLLAGSSISGKNGNKEEKNKGDLDYWIWKLDEKGNALWQKSFGGSKSDRLQSIAITADGGFILGGSSASDAGLDKKENSKGLDDFWIIKLNAKGEEMWQRTIGGNGMEELLSVFPTQDGGYILGGTSSSDAQQLTLEQTEDAFGKKENSRGNMDYWVVKLNSQGIIQWQKTLGGQYEDRLKSILQTTDKGFLLGGYSNSPLSGDKTEASQGQGDYWVVKLDENGIEQWQRTLGGEQDDNLFAMVPTPEGGFLLGGHSFSQATGNKTCSNKEGADYWVIKLDGLGNTLWQKTYDFGKGDILTSLVSNPDGSFLIGGYVKTSGSEKTTKGLGKNLVADKEGLNDYLALKIDAEGTVVWTQTVGSKGNEVMRKLLETRDGGYLLAGTSEGVASRDKQSARGKSDFWVVKLKDKEKEEKERIDVEALPNPAESFTNVVVNFDYEKGKAILYDLNGRSLQTIEIKGEHTIPVEVSNLPQGIYLIEITTNTHKGSVKVIKK